MSLPLKIAWAYDIPVPFNLARTLSDKTEAMTGIALDKIPLLHTAQEVLGYLDKYLSAIFAFYILACVSSGLAFLSCIFSLFYLKKNNHFATFVLFHICITGLSTLSLAAGSACTTATAINGAEVINNYGASLGISAKPGSKLMALSWIASAFMLGSFLFWVVLYCFQERILGIRSRGNVVRAPSFPRRKKRFAVERFRKVALQERYMATTSSAK